ncbi:DNA alkylation repair protein [Chitinophagaceae bacterium MMS25-I14]
MSTKFYTSCAAEVLQEINKVPPAIPHQRSRFRKGYSFSKLPFEEQLPVWNYIWNNHGSYRHKLQAFFYLETVADKAEHLRAMWPAVMRWQDTSDDWGLNDCLSKIYTKILEHQPDEVYATLKLWNSDTDLWKRRQSVVSLLYYQRTKTKYLPAEKITALILPLLTDKEYYVQKGIGWTLRELHGTYPDKAKEFLQKHIRNISAIAFTIAIEKYNDAERAAIKQLRKQA